MDLHLEIRKLGRQMEACQQQWQAPRCLDVIKKMKMLASFLSVSRNYHHQSWQLAHQMAWGRIIFHAVLYFVTQFFFLYL